jgi:hypothetical protein
MLFRRRLFSLSVPDSWDQVQPMRRRVRWMRWMMSLPIEAARRAMIRDITPRWMRKRLTDLDMAGLTMLLTWINDEPQCEQVPISYFSHRGVVYYFPRAKGHNLRGIDFALASDYYDEFLSGKAEALAHLAAVLWREEDPDAERAGIRDDLRVPIYNRTQAEQRAHEMRKAPAWVLLQALLYFGGLKAFVHRMYGTWLFEQDDEDEEDEKPDNNEPNFGWWGVFQDVALTGAYGDVHQVKQTMLHDLCVFLVKRQVAARVTSNQPSAPPAGDDDETDD